MISFSLAHDDIRAAARPSANEADWDHRYGGDQMWSGNPNGTLVNEISGLAPGRALDVGAGEGGDALWLAEQGWRVTASDISQRALDRVARRGRAPRSTRRVPSRGRERTRCVRSRSVRPRVGAVRIDPPHTRWPRRSQPAERGRSRWHAARGRATTSSRCARRSTRWPTAGRSTQTPTYGSTTSPLRSPTHRHGTSRSTRSDPVRPGPPLPRTTSTTSCCVPDAARPQPGHREQAPVRPLPWLCERLASARWGGAQSSRRPAEGAGRQPHGTRFLEGHHTPGPQRVHLLGRGCQAGEDTRTPHPPDPGRVWRTASVDPAAGRGANTANAPAHRRSELLARLAARPLGHRPGGPATPRHAGRAVR